MSFSLVLASTSVYRHALLTRLRLPFETVAPETDESPLPDEAPIETALRLAIAKAKSVGTRFPDALIIGSDQVVDLDGKAVSKPETHENAVSQLTQVQGRALQFHTGLCLLNTASGNLQSRVITITVHFRPLSTTQIETYLRAEQPYDCAGSAKFEGLGIALIEKIEGDDPNALVGLPLIELVSMLAAEGIQVI